MGSNYIKQPFEDCAIVYSETTVGVVDEPVNVVGCTTIHGFLEAWPAANQSRAAWYEGAEKSLQLCDHFPLLVAIFCNTFPWIQSSQLQRVVDDTK